MMGFRLALLVALVVMVSLLTSTSIASAQEESQGLAPNGLSAEICNASGWESVCLSWTLGTDDYTYQEVWFWQTGNTAPFAKGSLITPHSISERPIPILLLNQIRKSIYDNGSDSFTFQVVGVKRLPGNVFDYSGFSNELTLVIPRPRMEPVPQEPEENELPAPEEPEESEEPVPETLHEAEENTKPYRLTAFQDGAVVNLTWIPSPNPDYVKQVVLRREAVKGTELEVIHTFTREAGEMDIGGYSDFNVEAGKRYIYRIKALEASGQGAMTNAAKITVQ